MTQMVVYFDLLIVIFIIYFLIVVFRNIFSFYSQDSLLFALIFVSLILSWRNLAIFLITGWIRLSWNTNTFLVRSCTDNSLSIMLLYTLCWILRSCNLAWRLGNSDWIMYVSVCVIIFLWTFNAFACNDFKSLSVDLGVVGCNLQWWGVPLS